MELSMVSISLMFRKFYLVCISGWGATGGAQKASTDRLQETVVPIVQSSICVERMNQTGDVNEDLIVCAGGKGAGPCKVNYQRQCHPGAIVFYPGWQWRATNNTKGRHPYSRWPDQQEAWGKLQPAGLRRLHQRLRVPRLDWVDDQGERRDGLLWIQILCSANLR